MSRYMFDGGCNQVGNGILFIIALFFLSCAGCGAGGFGGGFGGGYGASIGGGCCCRRCC